MKIHKSVTIERVMEAIETDDHLGFCVACGVEHDGCEPDARMYTCLECDEHKVYGAEELLIMMA